MKFQSRSQAISVEAFRRVSLRAGTAEGRAASRKKYLSFARAFPTLIHTSGLAQTAAFALAKGQKDKEKLEVLDDLAAVIAVVFGNGQADNAAQFNAEVRTATSLTEYLQLSRQALQCASWIKRYSEALLVDQSGGSQTADESTNPQPITAVNASKEPTL